jgi:NADH-quinone oxidoreductase subunit J
MEQQLGTAFFYVCAVLALTGALATVTNPNPIRGAMGLLLMILAVAGLFLALHAQFLAAIQLIVYAGAIVVLFLFVIMLLGPSAMVPRDHRGRVPRMIGSILFGGGFLAVVGLAGAASQTAGFRIAKLGNIAPGFGGIDEFGKVLFSAGLVPFELSSALLMVAVLGAVAVARGKQRKATPVPSAELEEGEEA